jgi:transcriptional regulator with XRE-family HTH domain
LADEAVAGHAARRERLARRRRALGLTQESLAEVLGVERSTVARWERGDSEPLPSIRSGLAGALRVSADRLEELLADGGGGAGAPVPGYKAEEARMLNNIGWFHVQLGDYQQARAFCEQALTLSAEIGEVETQYLAWDSLGYLDHQLCNFADAVACYQRALHFCREVGAPYHEADIATHLGDTRYAAGELPQAAAAWRQALCILDDLNHPDAEKIRAKLAEIGA